MSYQTEREAFIARVTAEGLPLSTARLLLREATGLNRRAELACSSEAADRDRRPCPATKGGPCLCDSPRDHGDVPRIVIQDWHAERRVEKVLPTDWRMVTQ